MKKYFAYVILITIILPSSILANNFSNKNIKYKRLGGDSVEVVGLKYNFRLNKLIIPNAIEYNDSIFRVVSLREECFEDKRIKTIAGGAFNGCYLITSIILPHSLLKIEEFAFACCLSLQSLIINSCVKLIGNNAINSCPSLCKIICYAETPLHTEMLYDQNRLFQIESILTRPKNIILYVPNNSIEQYKKANGWSSLGDFKSIDSIK